MPYNHSIRVFCFLKTTKNNHVINTGKIVSVKLTSYPPLIHNPGFFNQSSFLGKSFLNYHNISIFNQQSFHTYLIF